MQQAVEACWLVAAVVAYKYFLHYDLFFVFLSIHRLLVLVRWCCMVARQD